MKIHAYACVAQRLNHELADKATVAADEARDGRAHHDPACAALWEHYVSLAVAGYGSEQAAQVRTNLENMPEAELFAHACPSYPAAARSCMTAATTSDGFDRCYTAKQHRCMSDSYTVNAYDACMH